MWKYPQVVLIQYVHFVIPGDRIRPQWWVVTLEYTRKATTCVGLPQVMYIQLYSNHDSPRVGWGHNEVLIF